MKKLISSLVAVGVILPVTAPPAHANKPVPAVLLSDGHGKSPSPGVNVLDQCTEKGKHCQPYAQLPKFPAALPTGVSSVGGHFHIAYPTTQANEEVNLVGETIVYNETTCAAGFAAGELVLQQKASAGPLPSHNQANKGGTITFDMSYTRAGAVAVFRATQQGKNRVARATLEFHPKEAPEVFAARCANSAINGVDGGPLKVFFDVVGTLTDV